MIRFAFFDRDGTLLYRDPSLSAQINARVREWTGGDFSAPCDIYALFAEAGYPDAFFLRNRENEDACIREERAFWVRFYALRLKKLGCAEFVEARAKALHEMTWLKGLIPYPDAIQTLEHFRARGVRMGVISDTSPSLHLTLKISGLSDYFESATCSAFAGCMKPDPRIYRQALSAMGARAEESLYVDDYEPESDGARAIGMIAFHIARHSGAHLDDPWSIRSLLEMIEWYDDNSKG